jgi:hypothetical protein
MTPSATSILPLLALILIPAIVTALAGWKILARAGYSGVWSLTLLVPLVQIIAVYLFALSRWPVQKSTKAADVFD